MRCMNFTMIGRPGESHDTDKNISGVKWQNPLYLFRMRHEKELCNPADRSLQKHQVS